MFSLKYLRLREQRRQPLQKFSQKAPQPPALKPPSTARTAGRSDWAERRFRRQPFILLWIKSSDNRLICPKYAEGASHTARGKPLRSSFKSHSHKRLTFAFTLEIGYTLVLTHKSAHSGSHAQTGRVSDGGCYHYPRRALRGPEPLRAQRSEEHTLPSLHGPRECRREAESLRCGILHCTNELRGFAIVMTECGEKFC